jgi:hypothetical protein
MSSHLFISYSRSDQQYARRLAAELRSRGFAVWIDDQIELGERWWREVVQAINECAALILLMSPAAAASEWVEKELMLAHNAGKPIFPLLLQGTLHPFAVNLQYVEVSDGQLPERLFYHRLKAVAPAMPCSLSDPERQTTAPLATPYLRLRPQRLQRADQPVALMLVWSRVAGADSYVVEQGVERSFRSPVERYHREQPFQYLALAADFLPVSCYRAKATARHRPESPWSNVVQLDLAARTPLPAPQITLSSASPSSPVNLVWNAVRGAVGYLLERGDDASVDAAATIFEGNENSFVDETPLLLPAVYCYRVKAIAWDGSSSPWSKVVALQGRPGPTKSRKLNR